MDSPASGATLAHTQQGGGGVLAPLGDTIDLDPQVALKNLVLLGAVAEGDRLVSSDSYALAKDDRAVAVWIRRRYYRDGWFPTFTAIEKTYNTAMYVLRNAATTAPTSEANRSLLDVARQIEGALAAALRGTETLRDTTYGHHSAAQASFSILLGRVRHANEERTALPALAPTGEEGGSMVSNGGSSAKSSGSNDAGVVVVATWALTSSAMPPSEIARPWTTGALPDKAMGIPLFWPSWRPVYSLSQGCSNDVPGFSCSYRRGLAAVLSPMPTLLTVQALQDASPAAPPVGGSCSFDLAAVRPMALSPEALRRALAGLTLTGPFEVVAPRLVAPGAPKIPRRYRRAQLEGAGRHRADSVENLSHSSSSSSGSSSASGGGSGKLNSID